VLKSHQTHSKTFFPSQRAQLWEKRAPNPQNCGKTPPCKRPTLCPVKKFRPFLTSVPKCGRPTKNEDENLKKFAPKPGYPWMGLKLK